MKKVLIGLVAFAALGAVRTRMAQAICHPRGEVASV